MTDKVQDREIDILRNIPKSELQNFIEKNGQRLRSLIESDEELNDQEILENLTRDYVWL